MIKELAMPLPTLSIRSVHDPFHWLQRRNNRNELHYFCWDVFQIRTVDLQNVEHVPDYSCVSHTGDR